MWLNRTLQYSCRDCPSRQMCGDLLRVRCRGLRSPWISALRTVCSHRLLRCCFPSNYAVSIWFCFTNILFLSAKGSQSTSRLRVCLAHLTWLVCSCVLNFMPIHDGRWWRFSSGFSHNGYLTDTQYLSSIVSGSFRMSVWTAFAD